MSYNPYIQRILAEQIQEFENLDLQDVPDSASATELNVLAYNPVTDRFFLYNYDPAGSGNVIINDNAKLQVSHTVNTDDLSTPRGFEFQKGWDLDAVVEALCNPPVLGSLSLATSPYLVEINQATQVSLVYTWNQGSEGGVQLSTVEYFRGSLAIVTIPDTLTATVPGFVTYKVKFRVDDTPQFPSSIKEATSNVKVVHPFLIGAGANDTLASVTPLEESDKQPLWDIDTTNYLIASFDDLIPSASPTPQNYYWFATEASKIPTEWRAVDAQGVEDPLNGGIIATAFSDIGNLAFKGVSYKVWMGIQPTFYSSRIKIKFN